MLAEPLLTFDSAGPEEPQAARLSATPAAETAKATERNFRIFISFPFIVRAQRWVPVTCDEGQPFSASRWSALINWSVAALAIVETFRNLATGEVNLTVVRITVKEFLARFVTHPPAWLTMRGSEAKIRASEMFRKDGIIPWP
ncbi:hypothetical protein [Arthrobacter oryzae]|uniref:hypothetical protein n=1 Tax=Arthrobacter oryzae TaxID=409290 RepID=UPI0030C91C8D